MNKLQIRMLRQGYCPICNKKQKFEGHWGSDGIYYTQWQGKNGKYRTEIYTCEHLDKFFDQDEFREFMRTGKFPVL